ncbi:hypothetical protein DFH06DRAFT_1136664 [Mycena polygramma]|nr:hypothetical protein DFH06DRAFT_1136664 [Mycena polygramma]
MSLSLLDLPTELLLQIFTDADLPVQELYSLALLCRHLHFIALPVYFLRNGLDSESRSLQIVMRHDRRDLLAALRVALIVPAPHVNDIAFVFPRVNYISILPLLEHLKRVQDFLSRIPSISKVSLKFGDVDGLCILAWGNDTMLRGWVRGLGDLLNCILAKQCTSLTVLYGSHLTKAYTIVDDDVAPTPVPPRRASWLRRLIFREKAPTFQIVTHGPPPLRRVIGPGDDYVKIRLKLKRRQASRLTSLHIQSRILLLPPGLSWTLDVLRSSPISHLTISDILLPSHIWTMVLSLFASAAPSLTSVTFHDVLWIPQGEAMRFIAQLNGLVELTITGFCLRISDTPPPRLPHLTRLRAPPWIIRYLLRQEGLPALQSVTVECCAFDGAYAGLVAEMLDSLILALDAVPRPTVPVFALVMYMDAWWDTWNWVHPTYRASLDRIQRIEMVLPSSTATDLSRGVDVIASIASRIGAFRRAVSAGVRFESKADSDVGTLPQRLAGAIVRTAFLQRIEVSGREYSLVGVE